MKSILIYGGSFDPPHWGHLKTALAVQHACHFQTVFFLPCKTPVLKKPTQANVNHRLHMLQLMLQQNNLGPSITANSKFQISTIELDRESPSYMTETLKQIRKTVGSSCSMTLLLGLDAFLNLPQWHAYEILPTLCNLLVIKRQSAVCPTSPDTLLHLFPTACPNAKDLLNYQNGQIAYFNAGEYPISSTEIRKKIRLGKDISDDVPKSIHDYIKRHGLYLDH